MAVQIGAIALMPGEPVGRFPAKPFCNFHACVVLGLLRVDAIAARVSVCISIEFDVHDKLAFLAIVNCFAVVGIVIIAIIPAWYTDGFLNSTIFY